MLYFDVLRHGESTLSHTLRGQTDDALTSRGWAQMQSTLLQAESSERPWDVIYTSPLQRCRLFAAQWAEQHQLPCYIEPQFQEMNFGAWEAQSTEYLYQQFPDELAQFWQTPLDFTPPQAESLIDFKNRVLQGLQKVSHQMQCHGWQHALLISHGGVIKLLKCHALQQHDNNLLSMTAELGQLSHFEMYQNQLRLIQAEKTE